MYEVTIPLRPVKDNEVGAPEDYFKIIREEYAARYLGLLNIASTPANIADFKQYRMMEDCVMVGVWPDMRTSSLADAIKIVPPLRQRIGDLADFDGSDRRSFRQWYGHADPILVRPPDIRTSGCNRFVEDDDNRNAGGVEPGHGAAGGASGGFLEAAKAKAELAAELERVRVAGAATGEVSKRVGARIDAERKERVKAKNPELVSLKAKFILPFACERPAKEGDHTGPSTVSELIIWPMEGPLRINAPADMWEEVLQPIRITLDDVRKNTSKWVDEQMPLELLTSRKDESLWEQARGTLKDAKVAKLTGLLAHLLHWVALMPLREDGPQISESALQSLFVGIHEVWSQFEKLYRDTKTGVSFVLPCLMLTVKRGMERCFEISYPNLMSHESLRQQVLDNINILLMRFFDPDGTYARFGKFDGESKAIALSKRLDAMMSSQGSTHTKRLHGRMHRATPLVRAVLGLMSHEGHTGTVCEPKTRVMMQNSDVRGGVLAGGMADPPKDRHRQKALLAAAMNRLPIQSKCEGSPRLPSSARQARSARRREVKAAVKEAMPQSARVGASSNSALDVTVSVSADPLGPADASGVPGRSPLPSPRHNASPKAREPTRLPALPRPARRDPL